MFIRIRPFKSNDIEGIAQMLAAEGLADKDMDFVSRETWVMEKDGVVAGFFTMREEHGKPYVVHFCTVKGSDGKRNVSDMWGLVAGLKNRLTEVQAKEFIMSIPSAKERILRIICHFFKGFVYAKRNGITFFLMEA